MPEFGQRDTQEVFPNYAVVLGTLTWPSIRDGRKELEMVEVEDMPPQRAASCLAKLVRWARYEPTGDLQLVDDTDMREESVRTCTLGEALAARALSLTTPMMHALFGEVGQGGSAEPRDIVAEITVALGDDYPQWELKERLSLAFHLHKALDLRYLIKERGHRE